MSLLDINLAVITSLRNNLTDPASDSRSGDDKFIYYKAPRTTPSFPFIHVSLGPFSLNYIGLGEGSITTYTHASELFSGDDTTKDFELSTSSIKLISSVEYPTGTTLDRYDYWTFDSADTVSFWSAPGDGEDNIKVNYFTKTQEDIQYTYEAPMQYTIVINSATNSRFTIGGSIYTDTKLIEYLISHVVFKWKAIKDDLLNSEHIEDCSEPSIGNVILNESGPNDLGVFSVPITFTVDGKIYSNASDIESVYAITRIQNEININDIETEEFDVV